MGVVSLLETALMHKRIRSSRSAPWDKARAALDVASLCRVGDEDQRAVCQEEVHLLRVYYPTVTWACLTLTWGVSNSHPGVSNTPGCV